MQPINLKLYKADRSSLVGIKTGEMMKNKKFLYIILLAVLILFSKAVYLFALDRDVILSELKRLKIKVTGSAKQIEAQLPIKLSGADWGLKKIVCEQGGYDLSAYAGKKDRKSTRLNSSHSDRSRMPSSA